MIRKILYVLILNILWFAPLNRIDIADLEPVRAVWMSAEEGGVVLETDTGSRGTGQTVAGAFADLKETSPGIVYLDTAEYILLPESALAYIGELIPYVKQNTQLCLWDGEGELETAVKYARAHKIGTKIRHWKIGDKLPNLPPQNLSK